ncbi:hypothetical protein SAMN04488505_1011001 [Chitinophaga rupis]|uniref:DUF2306 domain-containing protein n=1 Tax=Chitinophaga rupis TaxID=573321 RepID=A0A1H7KFZ0_9BACT|nr:hypothetical protein [Chitinophaga rupis]SEK84857.1 hypothetical protein SAMN04488505_1011001 [Chitinophaga rupis]
MEKIFTVTLVLHIIGGTLSLITGLVAMLAAKGKSRHRAGGKAFFVAMTLVFVTALAMSLMKGLTFLLMVAFFSYHLLLRGYRALYLKELYKGQRMALPDYLINGVGVIFNTGLLAWGASHLVTHSTYIHTVAVFFGLLGIWMAGSDIKHFIIPPKDKQQWLYTHIGGMCGAYVAAVTAFMVVNVHFLPGLMVWMAPVIIGGTLITLTINRYKRKFNKQAAATETTVPVAVR